MNVIPSQENGTPHFIPVVLRRKLAALDCAHVFNRTTDTAPFLAKEKESTLYLDCNSELNRYWNEARITRVLVRLEPQDDSPALLIPKNACMFEKTTHP